MTNTQVLRAVCEAALLTDAEAAAFLCSRLESLPENANGRGNLLVALAWIDPKLATAYAQGKATEVVQREIEKLREVHALHAAGREQLEAYHTLTALLPPHDSEALLRKQIYYWAMALTSPEEFLMLSDWLIVMTSPFLVARLWVNHTERLWKMPESNLGERTGFSSIGRLVLASRASEQDIAILVALLKTRSTATPYSGLSASSLFLVIGVLESRVPQEMAALAPQILCTLGRGEGYKDSILTARVLVMLARLELANTEAIGPLVERLKAQPNHRVTRRWARYIARMVRLLEPEPSEAHRLARLLQVLALEQSLESILTRKLNRGKQAQVRRAWRWLQKSDRVIESVPYAEWREHFRRKKAHLEQKVHSSRKAVHIAARTTGSP